MKLLYKSYSDMSIDDYFEMREMLSDLKDETDETVILFNILAFLCGVDVDDIYKSKISDINKAVNDITWALQPIKQKNCPPILRLGDWVCDVRLDMRKCTTEQFIDFTQFSKNRDKFYKECLACIIIPQGHNYNDGYDVRLMAEIIGKCVSIQTAEDIYLSFAVASKILLEHSLRSLARRMKKNLRKTKKEGMTLIRIKEMRSLIQIRRQIAYLSGLGTLML